MLLTDRTPKEIANILEISYDTVLYHQKKLYRMLGIQSRAELFVKYSSERQQKKVLQQYH
ncbi:MAG: LuxR C-terminal-related transcriptional regulator [Treponema sp.]|nr:LuxR C-terminal-related transcriptional regulator [Treponema sp.]